jgi:MOSC domain-containing protein YiiM
MATINKLKQHFPYVGKIEWIGLRTKVSREINIVNTAELLANHGLAGDKSAQKQGSKRQVTLIQAEYFPVLESFAQKKILPEMLRRNIVVSGINLSILQKHRLKINDVVLEITGNCAPCKKMEEVLGFGAFNMMRNHGGINAMVLNGGVINVGDEVVVSLEKTEEETMQKTLI